MPPVRLMVASGVLVCLVSATPVVAQGRAGGDSRAADAARAMNERRFEDAANAYRELLKAHPNEPEVLANLGIALAMGGHEAESVGPLERALTLNPKLTNAREVLASSYLA